MGLPVITVRVKLAYDNTVDKHFNLPVAVQDLANKQKEIDNAVNVVVRDQFGSGELKSQNLTSVSWKAVDDKDGLFGDLSNDITGLFN